LPQTTDLAAPLPVTNLLAGIKALTVKGIKSGKTYAPSFINSNIAAGSLGKMSLCYASYDNDTNPAAHDVPFGLATTTMSAFALSYKDADKTHTNPWKKTDGPALPSWFDDMALRLV
jgi:hypothetical protein